MSYFPVRYISELEIQREILKESKEILKSKILDNNSGVLPGGKILTCSPTQKYIFYKSSRIHENILKPILLDSAFRAEGLSGGSSDMCLSIIVNTLPSILKVKKSNADHKNLIDQINKSFDKIISDVMSLGHELNEKTFLKYLDNKIDDKVIKSIISNVAKMSSYSTSIFVKRSNATKSSIDIIEGYEFKIPIDINFLLEKDIWNKKSVNCILIDGMIETVGEIHFLLEKAAEDKQPYVIFCRDMSPDLLNTIYVNMMRGTIDIFPVCIGMNEKTINILNDIAAVCSSDVISSLKGDLISKSCIEGLAKMKSVKISSNLIYMENPESNTRVKNHIRFLEKERDKRTGLLEEDDSNIKILYDKRIKSLKSNKVNINFGTKIRDKNLKAVEETDNFLRSLGSMISYGFFNSSMAIKSIKKSATENNIDDVIKGEMIKVFKNYEIIPTSSAIVAAEISRSAIVSIVSIGAALIKDDQAFTRAH